MKSTIIPAPEFILRALYDHYGRPAHSDTDDILGTLIRAIISHQTTSQNASTAFGQLLDCFHGDWHQIATAPYDDVIEAISTAGLARQKAARIQTVLEQIRAQTGSYCLEFLRQQPVHQAQNYLLTFKGVGPKTAAFTLMYAAHMPLFPMDTHIFRICKRLGWLTGNENDQTAHDTIESKIPEHERYHAHMVLVEHGRKVCLARNPKCSQCPLAEWCKSATFE